MTPPPVAVADLAGAAVAALLFIAGMSSVPEPHRRAFNAILAAGTGGLYISAGFGPWELAYAAVVLPVAYRGLQSYRAIGVVWLMHSAWDLPHHLWNLPLWPYVPASSAGCVVFDAVIAVWFLAGAPSVLPRRRWRRHDQGAVRT